jgi:hypothetical protein
MKILLGLVLVCLVFAACKSESKVSGSAFVVAKNAQNFKLGGVQISAVPEKETKRYLELTAQGNADIYAENTRIKNAECERYTKNLYNLSSAELEQRKENLEECHRELSELENDYHDSILVGLPKAVAQATTDAEGKFSLKLMPGKYYITGKATRMIIDKTESYY